MSNELIKEAQTLCDKATEGPWKVYIPEESNGYSHIIPLGDYDNEIVTCYSKQYLADMDFIARSRTLVPELVEAIQRLVGEKSTLGNNLAAANASRDILKEKLKIQEGTIDALRQILQRKIR